MRILDQHFFQLSGALADGIEALESVANSLDANHPAVDEIDRTVRLLIRAGNESAGLQEIVGDMLRRQLEQIRSAKKAYEQGWDARLTDLLSHATPKQADTIHDLLLDIDGDEGDFVF